MPITTIAEFLEKARALAPVDKSVRVSIEAWSHDSGHRTVSFIVWDGDRLHEGPTPELALAAVVAPPVDALLGFSTEEPAR